MGLSRQLPVVIGNLPPVASCSWPAVQGYRTAGIASGESDMRAPASGKVRSHSLHYDSLSVPSFLVARCGLARNSIVTLDLEAELHFADILTSLTMV